jgi:hypothetical protein
MHRLLPNASYDRDRVTRHAYVASTVHAQACLRRTVPLLSMPMWLTEACVILAHAVLTDQIFTAYSHVKLLY